MALTYITSDFNEDTNDCVILANPSGPGHLLIVATVGVVTVSSSFSISDDAGNNWLIALPYTEDLVNERAWQIWYCPNAIVFGVTTITIHSSTPLLKEVFIDEFSGASTTFPLDQVKNTSGTTGLSLNSGSATTVTGNEIIYGFVAANGTPVVKGSSFNYGWNGSGADFTAYKIVSSTGSYSVDATADSNGWWTVVMLTFADIAITQNDVTTLSGDYKMRIQ